MTGSIYHILKSRGPMTGGALASLLQTNGVQPAAARKQIERARSPVHRLPKIRLPHNETFLYAEEHFKGPRFLEALRDAFETTGSTYGPLLHAIEARGLVQVHRLDALTGSPATITLPKHIPSASIRNRLEEIGLLVRVHVPSLNECVEVATSPITRQRYPRLRATLLAEDILLRAINEWARHIGLISYGCGAMRTPTSQPAMGAFQWDFVGPVYAKPFADGDSPGFFVADVALDCHPTAKQIQYFLNKVRIQNAIKRRRPFMAALIANDFEYDAFMLGKRNGLIMATPGSLLGADVGEALMGLLDVLSDAAAQVVANPDALADIFSRLGRIEGAAMNLRGPFLEVLVAHTTQKLGGGEISIGQIATDSNGRTADIDVLRRLPGQAFCYECKAKLVSGVVDDLEVETWVNNRVPRMHEWLSNDYPQHRQHTFELWTTGRLSETSKALLTEHATRTTRYTVSFKEGDEVEREVARLGEKRLLDTLREQFVQHPLGLPLTNVQASTVARVPTFVGADVPAVPVPAAE